MTSDTIRVVARLKARPDKVIEEWSGHPAIDAHFASEHIREALAQIPDLLADELDVRGYSLVA